MTTAIDRATRDEVTDDCEADYGDIGARHSADEITAWMREIHEPCGHTLHRITNVVLSATGTGAITAPSTTALAQSVPDGRPLTLGA
jgi:hypothetical protein